MYTVTLVTDYICLRRIIHLQNRSELTEKQMDKVSWIVLPKLRPFHFQIMTYYLSDANYPTDNPSQTDRLWGEYDQYQLRWF